MKRGLIALVFISLILISGISGCSINPAEKSNATIEKLNMTCNKDADCGTNYLSALGCSPNTPNVVQQSFSYICVNPGTSDSFCNVITEELQIEQCQIGCADGKCRTSVPACIKEGDTGYGYKFDKCCEGLDGIASAVMLSDGSCGIITDTSFVCTKCGDGTCSSWENKCICSEDCS